MAALYTRRCAALKHVERASSGRYFAIPPGYTVPLGQNAVARPFRRPRNQRQARVLLTLPMTMAAARRVPPYADAECLHRPVERLLPFALTGRCRPICYIRHPDRIATNEPVDAHAGITFTPLRSPARRF